MAEAEKPPTPISLPPLSEKAPAGKTVAFISCGGLTNCIEVEEAAKEATELIGWKLEVFHGELTPEKQVSALSEAVQAKPVGIIDIMIVPPSVLAKPLAEATKANIPVVGIADAESPKPPVITALINLKEQKLFGSLLADWVFVDSEGQPTQVLDYTSKENLAIEATAKAADEQLTKNCPECEVKMPEYSVASQGVGTKLANEVVSEVQRNPETKYIIFPTGAATPGVGAALQAAGFNIKIIAKSSSTVNQTNIVEGIEAAGVGEEITGNAWRGVDSIARSVIGDPVEKEPEGEYQLLTAENIKNPSVGWTTPEISKAFEKIWLIK